MAETVSNASSRVLLIDEGDLPSLAAVVLQPERSELVLWHQVSDEAASELRLRAVHRHEQMTGAEVLLTTVWADAGGAVVAPRRLRRGLLLMQASIIASRHGCSRIVWPVQTGPDAPAVCEAVDAATAVMELAHGEEGGSRQGRGVSIELPLVDLTEAQVVDLVDDAGAPMRAFWPCDGGGSEPCGHCGECRRWAAGFSEMGLPWPWSLASTAV